MAIAEAATTSPPRLSNYVALLIFVFILSAYVLQTHLTQYVQTELGYRQPYFLFYLTHSSFIFILPLHLVFLLITTGTPISEQIRSLRIAVRTTYGPSDPPSEEPKRPVSPYTKFALLIVFLTFGVSAPSLLWYTAVSLTSISSVTALFNTNAFWTYLLSLALLHDPFRTARLGAVVLASIGVVIDAYGGACTPASSTVPAGNIGQPTAPFLGNALAFIASVSYSFFQVLYKRYATSPASPSDFSAPAYAALPTEDNLSRDVLPAQQQLPQDEHASTPLPFALYANFITTLIGVATITIFCIPIPLLHYYGLEVFHLPPDNITAVSIFLIASCGMSFNAGFMILIGVWGPIVTSVGSLLTTVLVLIVDVAMGGCVPALSWVGCSFIAVAFAVLAGDIFAER